jgi:hypothetical protein
VLLMQAMQPTVVLLSSVVGLSTHQVVEHK